MKRISFWLRIAVLFLVRPRRLRKLLLEAVVQMLDLRLTRVLLPVRGPTRSVNLQFSF